MISNEWKRISCDQTPGKYKHCCFILELAFMRLLTSQLGYSPKRKGKRQERQRGKKKRLREKEKEREVGWKGGKERGRQGERRRRDGKRQERKSERDQILHMDFNLTVPVTALVPWSSCFKKVGYRAAKEIWSPFLCCSSSWKKKR